MNLRPSMRTPQLSVHPLHQSLVVKYTSPTSSLAQGTMAALDTLHETLHRTLDGHEEGPNVAMATKVLDISVQTGRLSILLPSGRRLRLTIRESSQAVAETEIKSAHSIHLPFLLETEEEDFLARPSMVFNGPEYLSDQTKVCIVYNTVLNTPLTTPQRNPHSVMADSKLSRKQTPSLNTPKTNVLTLYTTIIFTTSEFLGRDRLLLDASIQVTNCAFNEYMIVLSTVSGHLIFIDREQLMPPNHILTPAHYSYYKRILYVDLAKVLMREFHTVFQNNFTFRESLRLLSISSPKHVPFLFFRKCDLVIIMPLGSILSFIRQRRQDDSVGELILAHANIALPFTRKDLPDRSFSITHYAASIVTAVLPVSNTILVVGYDNSVLQYYCWDADSSVHPLDGMDLNAGRIVHIHAGTMYFGPFDGKTDTANVEAVSTVRISNDAQLDSPDCIKVLIVASIGSNTFFVIQLFPKLTHIMTITAPNRFISSGKVCSPTSDTFSSVLIYTTADSTLKYIDLPRNTFFRSGMAALDESSPYYGLQKSKVQQIVSSLQNVMHKYEEDESASDLNVLNERTKGTLPTFILDSNDKEVSSSTEDKKAARQPMMKIDMLSKMPRWRNTKSPARSRANISLADQSSRDESFTMDFDDAFALHKCTDNRSVPLKAVAPRLTHEHGYTNGELTSPPSEPSEASDAPQAERAVQPVCRPFEHVTVRVGSETTLTRIQHMYSIFGTINRRKLDVNERVAYDDNSLSHLLLVRSAQKVATEAALKANRVPASEFQHLVSPKINLERWFVSSRNAKRAIALLQRNEHIFYSPRNKIQPHIRSAYSHLKRMCNITDNTSARQIPILEQTPTRSPAVALTPGLGVDAGLQSPINIPCPRMDIKVSTPLTMDWTAFTTPKVRQQMHHMTRNPLTASAFVRTASNAEGTATFPGRRSRLANRRVSRLASEFLLGRDEDLQGSLLHHYYSNAWSPSPRRPPHHDQLSRVIMRSRIRQAELDAKSPFGDLTTMLHSKVLGKPSRYGARDTERHEDRFRNKVHVNKYEHEKVIDKELLRDLRRFRALKMGVDLTRKILHDRRVLTALLTGDNAADNIKDLLELTGPGGSSLASIDDILIMADMAGILDPENDGLQNTFSSCRSRGTVNVLESLVDIPRVSDEMVPRLETPDYRVLATASRRSERVSSQTASSKFGLDLMGKLLHTMDYRINKRRVRSGINGMISIGGEYERIVLLRRSASLPTLATLNENRVALTTKLDSSLGYEMGISRWDSAANRDYRARFLGLSQLSDPDSSLYTSEDDSDSFYEAQLDKDIHQTFPAITMNSGTIQALDRAFSGELLQRLPEGLEREVMPQRPHSVKAGKEASDLDLEPLDIKHHLKKLDKQQHEQPVTAEEQTKEPAATQQLPVAVSDPKAPYINVIEGSDPPIDATLDRLTSASDVSESDSVVEPLEEPAVPKKESIFGMIEPFDPRNYTISAAFLPDIILRETLQVMQQTDRGTRTLGQNLQYLLRDDCSQIFKIRKRPVDICDDTTVRDHRGHEQKKTFHYGSNPLMRQCMRDNMFCPRVHYTFDSVTTRNIALNTLRRTQSFDNVGMPILRKRKNRGILVAHAKLTRRSQQNRIVNRSVDGSEEDIDATFDTMADNGTSVMYNYLTPMYTTGNARHGPGGTGSSASAFQLKHRGSISVGEQLPSTWPALNMDDIYAAELRSKAFSVHYEEVAVKRATERQRDAAAEAQELKAFKSLFTRELYEDWARIYRHNVIRPDTLYDDQFETTIMKPTFPLRYNVMTNQTQASTILTQILLNNDEDDELHSTAGLHVMPVITKAELHVSATEEQTAESLLDEMQLALGQYTDSQSASSAIPHHYAVPPKPPYYNPRMPILDDISNFYSADALIPLEPLVLEKDAKQYLQIGVYTPYDYCIKNPNCVDNEKLSTILGPVNYTNCRDFMLASSHVERPPVNISHILRKAGYAKLGDGGDAGGGTEWRRMTFSELNAKLDASDEDLDMEEVQEMVTLQLDAKAAFNAKVREFIKAFGTIIDFTMPQLAEYHTTLYSRTFYALASQIENFAPKVRCCATTVKQVIKNAVEKYLHSFMPAQRKIIKQTAARGVQIDYNRLNYMPISFLQIILLYSSSLALLELMKGQKHAAKGGAIHCPFVHSHARLTGLLSVQFPEVLVPLPKGTPKEDTYGKKLRDFPTTALFNFYSVQDVLNYKYEPLVRYLLIIVHYVRVCNIENFIFTFADYRLRKVLKQDDYIEEITDPYRNVVELYERMTVYIRVNGSMRRMQRFSQDYEKMLRTSIFRMAAPEVTCMRASSLLTYFGPKFNPTGLTYALTKGTAPRSEDHEQSPSPKFCSSTMAVLYDDTKLRDRTVTDVLSKYALTCMLKDTSLHIHGVHSAVYRHFARAGDERSLKEHQYFSSVITNLITIPLSVLFLVRQLEEIEDPDAINANNIALRYKLQVLLLDAYYRKLMIQNIWKLGKLAPLAHLYTHLFRVPGTSSYRDYPSMVEQRQAVFYKVLHGVSLLELKMRFRNSYILMQPRITSILGIPRTDALAAFFSEHCHPVYVSVPATKNMAHKLIVGEGIYSEAYENDVDSTVGDSQSSAPPATLSETVESIEPYRRACSPLPPTISWYDSLYSDIIQKPLSINQQKQHRNRSLCDLHDDYMAALDQGPASVYKGDPKFETLLRANNIEAMKRHIDFRRTSLEHGALEECTTLWDDSEYEASMAALGRRIFRSQILNSIRRGIMPRQLEEKSEQTLVECSSAEELCNNECFADPIGAGERLVANTTAKLLDTRMQTKNVALWATIAEQEEQRQEKSCGLLHENGKSNRATFDCTYELRKAFTDIRPPKYRSSSILSHTHSRKLDICIRKPLPTIKQTPGSILSPNGHKRGVSWSSPSDSAKTDVGAQ